MTLLYKDIIAIQSMPSSMSTAVISVLPKAGKDHSHMGNFCPLSLLNNDYKVFTKLLAMCLEKVIFLLINLDQVGFITRCHAAHNIRRLFHVMLEASYLQRPVFSIVFLIHVYNGLSPSTVTQLHISKLMV